MKKLTFLFFAGACLLLFAMACSQSDDVTGTSQEDAPKREVIELSYSIFFPPTHAHSKAAEAWAREIESRSDNMVKINIYPGGTLTGAGECYDGVVSGISDIGMSVFAYSRGRFPVMEALDLPMGYPTGKVATRVANDFYNELQPKELDDVKLLYLHAHGPGLLHTKKPVQKLEDLKGMQIRSTGLSAKMVSALGATPVAMPMGDTYEALHKGVVEGTFAPIEALKGWRQAEVISSTTDCKEIGYTTAMFVVMNKNKFNSMPEDIQSVFKDVSEEWIEEHGTIWDVADEEGLAYTTELENQVFDLSEEENMLWKKAIESVIDEYVETAESKGLQGRKNVELLRALIDRQS